MTGLPTPRSNRSALRALFWTLILVLPGLIPCQALSEGAPRDKLTAAYLFRLAQNIQWANEAGIDSYHIHLVGDTRRVSENLAAIARVSKLHNKPFVTTWSKTAEIPGDAHLVFVAADKQDDYATLSQQAEGRNILLVSENIANKRIIMINLFANPEKQLRFEINKANILNQNLGINPDIILLGGSEIDVAKLYRESQASLREQEKLVQKQKMAVIAEQARFKEAEARTRELEATLLRQQQAVETERARLADAVARTRQQEAVIAAQEQRFHTLTRTNAVQQAVIERQTAIVADERRKFEALARQSAAQQAAIDHQKTLAAEERRKYDALTQSVRQRETALARQEQEITARSAILSQQDEKIKKQDTILASQSTTIATQRHFIYAVSAAALLAAILMIAMLRAYRQTHRANAMLQEQKLLLEQTAAELAKAEEHAAAANRAKSAFLANMSHELRTPMNAILGFSQIMARDGEVTPSQKEKLAIILKSGEHLLSLINDVLDLSRIEAGKITPTLVDTDIATLLTDLAAMLRVRAEAKGLRLDLDQSSSFPRFARTDPAKLRQIIINLVGNAIKFTENGHIAIKLSILSMEQDPTHMHLLFEVSDTGLGIPPEDLERIFSPFEQVQGKAAAEGTGLGLAIAQKYVTLLGGTITVDSAIGKGSVFRFSITCDPVDATLIGTIHADDAQIESIENARAFRILAVEDHLENRLLLKNILTHFGFQYREAGNGRDAISIAQEWHPHLILMDRRMPVMDGLAATRELRKLALPAPPVIIAITAHAFEAEQQEMLTAGCSAFLGKPFHERDLIKMICRHLDIQIQYTDAAPPPGNESASPLTQDSFAGLPDDLSIELETALTNLDMVAVDKAIAGIHKQNPILAARLKREANNLAYSDILNALKRAGHLKPE